MMIQCFMKCATLITTHLKLPWMAEQFVLSLECKEFIKNIFNSFLIVYRISLWQRHAVYFKVKGKFHVSFFIMLIQILLYRLVNTISY